MDAVTPGKDKNGRLLIRMPEPVPTGWVNPGPNPPRFPERPEPQHVIEPNMSTHVWLSRAKILTGLVVSATAKGVKYAMKYKVHMKCAILWLPCLVDVASTIIETAMTAMTQSLCEA